MMRLHRVRVNEARMRLAHRVAREDEGMRCSNFDETL